MYNKQKDQKILFLQIYGIFLVVLGHSPTNYYLNKWIYSFHMPLFMFISGYLLIYTTSNLKNIDYNNFVRKKLKRLIIPYFLWITIAYIPKYILNSYAKFPVELSLKSYLIGFLYPKTVAITFYWFLPTLFFIMLIIVGLYKKLNINTVKLLIIILILNILYFPNIGFLNMDGIIKYSLYFVLGIYYFQNKEKFERFLLEKKELIIITFIILNLNLIIEINFVKSYLYQSIIAIIGIIFSICLAEKYIELKFKFLKFFEGTSYSIYLFSWFPQTAIRIIVEMLDLKVSIFVLTLISFSFGIGIPFLINKLGGYLVKKEPKLKLLKYILGL